jgi:hypothetical protein
VAERQDAAEEEVKPHRATILAEIFGDEQSSRIAVMKDRNGLWRGSPECWRDE